jgi:hypothetical protein
MQTIVTQSTRERVIRNGLVALMLLGYSCWSFYDGYIGYPKDNLRHARGEVPADYQAEATINPAITKNELPNLRRGQPLREAEELLGPPAWKGKASDEFNKAVWFGPGGTVILRYNDLGLITSPIFWKDHKHIEKDLFIQKAMGVGVGTLGLFALVRVLIMLFARVKLSDAGLTTASGRLIPFDAMTGWDPSDYRDKGRITLTYQDGNRERQYVLDDYKLTAFKPLVEEISARKGFENPLTEPNSDRLTADAAASEVRTCPHDGCAHVNAAAAECCAACGRAL